MKTEWDYTELADAYLKRPDYSDQAITKLLQVAGLTRGGRACDVGAGCAHLTIPLLSHGFQVLAIEPNDAMRRNGSARTKSYGEKVHWIEATSEDTKQPDTTYDLVTFGSSFGVADRQSTLKETARILKPGGWFACMWNHRDLNDPTQAKIEEIIKFNIPEYDYGVRREDQTSVIDRSNLFGPVKFIEGNISHSQSVVDCLEAWHSHATVARQAGEKRKKILGEIESLLKGLGSDSILIPYTTRIWAAPVKKAA